MATSIKSTENKEQNLFEEVKTLIEQTKQNVAVAVNSSMTLMYWEIGNKISQDILQNQRTEYGKEIVATLLQQLSFDMMRKLK